MATIFIARRLLHGITRENNIATMLGICIASITLSTFCLTLIIAVANGLHHATTVAVQGFHSDCTLQAATGTELNFAAIHAVLQKEYGDSIAHASPISYQHAIIQKEGSNDISHVVTLQGIDPVNDPLTRPPIRITTAHADTALWDNSSLVLGASLANALQVAPGDLVTLIFSSSNDTSDDESAVEFSKTSGRVSALFTTGIEAVDERMVLCSLHTLTTLFLSAPITQINLKLTPLAQPTTLLPALERRFKLTAFAWQELYPALMDALALEQKAIFIIIALVALITSSATVALLLMYLMHQQSTLAVLRAMGMRMCRLRAIFTLIGTTITFFATSLGLILAALTSWLLEHYKLISLPDIYYINYLPARLDPTTLFLVASSMIFVSLLTNWWATGHIKKMNLTPLLKR